MLEDWGRAYRHARQALVGLREEVVDRFAVRQGEAAPAFDFGGFSVRVRRGFVEMAGDPRVFGHLIFDRAHFTDFMAEVRALCDRSLPDATLNHGRSTRFTLSLRHAGDEAVEVTASEGYYKQRSRLTLAALRQSLSHYERAAPL